MYNIVVIDLHGLTQTLQLYMDFLGSIQFGFNWLDIMIILVFAFYAFESVEIGFMAAFFDLTAFVASFVLALLLYSDVGYGISQAFSIPKGFGNAIGFFLIAFFAELILNVGLHKLFSLLREKFRNKKEPSTKFQIFFAYIKSFNNWLGLLPGLICAYILLSFLLTTILALPFSSYLKHTVSSSRFGNILVANTQTIEKKLNDAFGGALLETLNFFTVAPESNEFVQLQFKTEKYSVDEDAEGKMITLVNTERTSRGLKALKFDEKLRAVARLHSEDMLKRGYFSHFTPEGISPFDRMAKANITYGFAGENLALAPNVDLAMHGLMNSPGHKANILSPKYNKIGVGTMDAGIYGEMFSQEFSD